MYSHVVFSTKNRRPQIAPDIQSRLYSYIGGIVANEKCVLVAAGGVPDHVHLLVSLRAQTSLADLLRLIKSNSSRWIHETFAEQSAFAWQDGYGAFSVSCSNVDAVKAYIADQERHHQKMSFEEEFVAFLKKHGIPYDERYLWS